MEFQNLIGGKECIMSGKRFSVSSPFFAYEYKAPDSSLMDINLAISSAKDAMKECNSIDFEERHKILKNAAKIKFSKSDVEYVVKMTGMPVTDVKTLLDEIHAIMNFIPSSVENWVGIRHGKIGTHVMENSDMFRMLHPVEGFAYGVTPGNDPRIVSFLASWFVTLGMPAIIKISKNDFMISQKIIKKIINEGYPSGGLNVLCWDTDKPENKQLNYHLVDAAKAVTAFGTNETVDKHLRFEENNGATKDHFSDKIVIKHISGRTSAVFSSNNVKENAHKLIESSVHWPIGCKALKSVFDATQSDELPEILREEFEKLSKYTGDPMKNSTRVGYVDSKIVEHVKKRVEDLSRLGLIKKIAGEFLSDTQTTPLLLRTEDKNSEFLSTEFSMYILALKKCKNYEDGVKEMNESSGGNHRITVGVFEDDEEKVLKTFFKAHHIKRMKHTFELDLLFHEGHDYLHKLTTPQIHRVSRSY